MTNCDDAEEAYYDVLDETDDDKAACEAFAYVNQHGYSCCQLQSRILLRKEY